MDKLKQLLAQHGDVGLVHVSNNYNATMWFGGKCSKGCEYQVLVDDNDAHDFAGTQTLRDLYDQTDLLEVSVDGYTVY